MKKATLFIFFMVSMFSLVSMNEQRKTQTENIDYILQTSESVLSGKPFFLDKVIDLKGKTFEFPEGASIVNKGGLFKNGTLVGNDTRIVAEGVIFDNIRIKGTWDVPVITTSLFKDLSYTNSLRDVIGLTNPNYHNTIFIERGSYSFDITDEEASGIELNDNTDIFLKGTLTLIPNNLSRSSVVYVKGKNIRLVGDGGVIKGDKQAHKGLEGEWGMGVNVHNSSDCVISNLNIQDCWGDCIYVGIQSSNIVINNCHLKNARRQGISITSGKNISIIDCIINDVKGTAPEYGIDIEPNSNETVENVIISGVKVSNCVGGILLFGKAKGAVVKDITINNCVIKECSSPFPLRIEKAADVTLLGNQIVCNNRSRVMFDSISNLKLVRFSEQLKANRKDAIKLTNSNVYYSK